MRKRGVSVHKRGVTVYKWRVNALVAQGRRVPGEPTIPNRCRSKTIGENSSHTQIFRVFRGIKGPNCFRELMGPNCFRGLSVTIVLGGLRVPIVLGALGSQNAQKRENKNVLLCACAYIFSL